MAAHDELMELQMKDVDSEDGDDEEELGDGKWDDWKEDEGADGESECNPLLLCLFCDSLYGSARSLFQHCASMHSFDYYGIKSACNLDFYGCLKLINYVRAQVASHKCWSCGNEYMSDKALQEHLHGSPELDRGSFPWSDDKYLKPFLHDDALLYSFSEDDDDDDEDEEDKKTMSIDEKEMKLYLSKFERIEMDHEDADTDIVCDNGGKDALLHADTDELDSKGSERLPANGVNYLLGGKLSGGALRNGRHGICSARLTNEINSINKDYFASYSSFGIHRDMISDKARTDAYRQAISENPSLMRRAVVMDVGCGTGILSLFAAQAGASMVIAVEASAKMAAVATQIARDNNVLSRQVSDGSIEQNGVIQIVQCVVEELEGNDVLIKPKSVDVIVSEWMGYCLLYESMLTSVLFARDRWLKPGGAILPDTARMFVAGFGRGATSIPFWENVYGFDMSCIGREITEDAARFPVIGVVDECDVVTTTGLLQAFDLMTMQPKQMEFTAEVEMSPKRECTTSPSKRLSCSEMEEVVWCYGVAVWFETGFTERFCRENPVILSTSPYEPTTHWSQTLLTFREPVAMAASSSTRDDSVAAPVGTRDCPAARIRARISIVKASKHRSIDLSLEITCIGGSDDGRKRILPAQFFSLD